MPVSLLFIMAGIYIHIPFCKQACYYCDFHFSTNVQRKEEMVNAIVHEIELQRNFLEGEPVKTIYLGGGTPSMLSKKEMAIIFQALHTTFPVDSLSEITVEANPDDLSIEKLNDLFELGVNRLSIGIQSFDDRVLEFLHRAHDSQAAESCVAQARAAGFKNISIDLIYSIPGQDDAAWRRNIEKALSLQPEHISSYSLTIEEKTVFGRWAAKGKLNALPDDEAANQLELLVDLLEQAGFEQYEVSNFARPGFQSQHNSSYWKQEKYLGLGPSAHSYNGVVRQFNISNNHHYLKALTSKEIPATTEVLSVEDKINDYLLTTLRTSWGTDLKKLGHYGYDLSLKHQPYLDTLVSQGHAILTSSALILTKKGRLLADKISSDLFVTKA